MRNEIQVGRYSQLLARLLSMDEGAPSPTLATDIFPTLQLEGNAPEWRYLAGVRLASGFITDAAVAGQYSHCLLTNPAGSGIIAVCTKIVCNTTGAASGTYGIQAVSVAPTQAGYAMDGRWSLAGQLDSACQLGTYTNAVGVAGIHGLWVAGSATSLTPVNTTLIIPPGYQIIVRVNTVNVGLTTEFDWYERQLLPSETR